MLTRDDLRIVFAEALRGAADHLQERVGYDARSAHAPAETGDPAPDGRLLVSVSEAATALGVSRGKAYELIASGRLASVKIGRRRLVSVTALGSFVESL